MRVAETRLLVAIVAAALVPGCSFAFIDTVPDSPERLPYFDCTSTYGLPVADGLFALSGAVGAVTTLSQSKEEFEDKNEGGDRDLAAGINIAIAAVMVASGIYGIIHTEQCADAKRELKARLLSTSERRPLLPPPEGAAEPQPAPIPPANEPAVQPPAQEPPPAAALPATDAQPQPELPVTPESVPAPPPAEQPATPPAGSELPQSPY